MIKSNISSPVPKNKTSELQVSGTSCQNHGLEWQLIDDWLLGLYGEQDKIPLFERNPKTFLAIQGMVDRQTQIQNVEASERTLKTHLVSEYRSNCAFACYYESRAYFEFL